MMRLHSSVVSSGKLEKLTVNRDFRERVGEVGRLRKLIGRIRAAHERDADLPGAHPLDGGEHLIGVRDPFERR